MEKGTREVRCPNCLPEVTIITIKVTVETFGKRVRIKCRKCLTTFITEPIPVPAAEPEQAPAGGFPFSEGFGDIFDFLKPKR